VNLPNPSTWLLVRLLICALLFLGAGLIAAERDEIEMVTPPYAGPVQVNAFVDRPKEVALDIRGRIREPLRIVIRKPPRYGTLGEPYKLPGGGWGVLYTPGPKASPGQDEFVYAVQSKDSPVSASANVAVGLVRRPASLVFPVQPDGEGDGGSFPRPVQIPVHLDFGAVPIGESVRRSVLVGNTGGVPAVVDASVAAPWRQASEGVVSIPPDGAVGLSFEFKPEQAGAVGGRVPIGGDGWIRLTGEGLVPVEVVPPKVIDSLSRQQNPAGTVEFHNPTDASRRVEIDWPSLVDADGVIDLPASGSLAVPVSVSADDPQASFQGEVAYRSGDFESSFLLQVSPAPGRLVVAEVCDLGEGTVGDSLAGQLELHNDGGSPLFVRTVAPGGISLTPPGDLSIPPGGQQVLRVSKRLREAGDFSEKLTLQEAGGERVVRLLSSAGARKVPVASLLDIPDSRPVKEAVETGAIPGPQESFLVEQTTRSVTVGWEPADPPPAGYLFEERTITRGPNGIPTPAWVAMRRPALGEHDGLVTASFVKLPPGSFRHVRIRALDDKHLPGEPSPMFRIETASPRGPLVPFAVWFPAGLVLAALLLFLLYRRLVPKIDDDLDQRIAALEK
jgi:hypothetical protein